MRENLYRGMRKDGGGNNDGWVYGDLVHDAYDGTSMSVPVGIQVPGCYPFEVIPETVGQFIGRKDVNDKHVFEGDKYKFQVLKSPDGISSAHNINYWIDVECEIVFDNAEFCGRYEIKKYTCGDHVVSERVGMMPIPGSVEIIATIHDKELTK